MKVINFFGGPAAGKSTVSTGLVHCMKKCQVLADYVPEFAKELIYANTPQTLDDQLWVFANQARRIHVTREHVDFAVVDSPLPLSSHYAREGTPDSFHAFVMDTFRGFDNVNYFVERNKSIPYQQEGRVHSAAESDDIADALRALLDKEGVSYKSIVAGNELPERIFADLARRDILSIPEHGLKEATRLVERANAYEQSLTKQRALKALGVTGQGAPSKGWQWETERLVAGGPSR